MVKTKFIVVYAWVIVIVLCTSCCCSHNYVGGILLNETLSTSKLDTIQKYSRLNDSIIRIMKHPQKITCVLGGANPIDSLRSDTTKVLPKEMYPILDFLIWDPTNFESNDIVFGNFSPSVNYIINSRRNTQITLQFDFGLKKWRILDKDLHVIISADLKDNRSILRFTRIIFPTDSTLQLMNKNLNSISK